MEILDGLLKSVAKKFFPGDPDALLFPTPNIFTDFAKGIQEKCYNDIKNFDVLRSLLNEALEVNG